MICQSQAEIASIFHSLLLGYPSAKYKSLLSCNQVDILSFKAEIIICNRIEQTNSKEKFYQFSSTPYENLHNTSQILTESTASESLKEITQENLPQAKQLDHQQHNKYYFLHDYKSGSLWLWLIKHYMLHDSTCIETYYVIKCMR